MNHGGGSKLKRKICPAVQDQIDHQLLVEKHEKWLRGKPRSTMEFLEQLDLPLGYPWTYYLSIARRMNLALWDAGYTSYPDGELNPIWHWCWYEETGRRGYQSRTQISEPVEPIIINNRSILDPYNSHMPPLRKGLAIKLPYYQSSGPAEILRQKAKYYLQHFNHEKAYRLGSPGITLMNVICNLRNYYKQDAASTVSLMTEYFLSNDDFGWTGEHINEVWQLVEGITPSLSLIDKGTIQKRRNNLVEDYVIDLIAHTKPGDRIETNKFLNLFNEWYPDFPITPRELGVAVHTITGTGSKPINGKRFYVGFQIP
jgi:hypothetical protein